MPLGNGDIAAGVCAIEDGDPYPLLSKNDALTYNGDIFKTGCVRISLTPDPFARGKPFRQTLDLPTGSIHIEADDVSLRIWADANRPVYHVQTNSPDEISVSAVPEFWQPFDDGGSNTSRAPIANVTRDVRLERNERILWYFAVGDRSVFPTEMLTARGKPIVYTKENSENFEYIGMPIGGICAGQLYLGGDGRLWFWDIFNINYHMGQLKGEEAYQFPYVRSKPGEAGTRVIEQGFSVRVKSGDRAQGKLTSQPFKISRWFVACLVGGGKHPDKTCVNILVDGRIVATATGRNSENLQPVKLNVRSYEGKEAVIEMADAHDGGWGHVLVDQIVFTDEAGEPIDVKALPDFGTMSLTLLGGSGASFAKPEGPAEQDLAAATRLVGQLG